MRRVSRLIALCLCGLMLLCSCEQPDPQPTATGTPAPIPTATLSFQSIRFNLGYDPTATLDPITGNSQVNQELTGLVYQCLYELDNTFTPRPVLARTASAGEDALTWTFTLAEGVVFSDGTPLTAAHVAASLNRARTSALYATRLAGVASVAAGEDGSVTVTLSRPNGNLPALLDVPIVLEQGPSEDGTEPPAPLGTGYYQYVQAGERLYLLANPYHPSVAALPYSTIPLTPVTDTGERIAAFDSGEITAVTTDFSSPYALDYSGGYEATDYPTTSLLYVGFNAAKRVCKSALVRQAFSQAFDRAALVEVQLAGHGDPAALPISPLNGEYSETHAAMLDYDMDAAAQLLAQAGCVLSEEDGLLHDPDGLFRDKDAPLVDENGRPIEQDDLVRVTLLVNSDNAVRQAVARQLADGLSRLGITVTVSSLSWVGYNNALTDGEFDLYIGEVRLTGDFDSSVLLAGALNYSGVDNQALARAMTQWRINQGEWRVLAANTLWGQFVRDLPIAPLCFKRESLLVRWGMVSNVQPTRANPYDQISHWTITG